MIDLFHVTVKGRPATQGSMRGFVVQKAGQKARAVVTADSKKLKPWRKLVHDACCKEQKDSTKIYLARISNSDAPVFSEAVSVSVVIILPRLAAHPKTHKGKPPGPPIGKGDLDKHQRAIGDALTTSRVLADDGLICQWTATKRYAFLEEEPGAWIEVRPYQQ